MATGTTATKLATYGPKAATVARAINSWDAASNTFATTDSAKDIKDNGANWQNVLGLAGSSLGVAGNASGFRSPKSGSDGGTVSSSQAHSQGQNRSTNVDDASGQAATQGVDAPVSKPPDDQVDNPSSQNTVSENLPPEMPPYPTSINLSNPGNIWGYDAEALRYYFAKGEKLNTKVEPTKPKSSGLAQVFSIEGHPEIKTVQYHPGGGSHKSKYYKFDMHDRSRVKIIDPDEYKFVPEGVYEKGVKFFNPQGQRIDFIRGQWVVISN